MARRARGHAGDADRDPARGRRHHHHLPREGGGALAERAVASPDFDPSTIRAVAFDGYGTLFAYHDDEFRAAVTMVLADQGIAHPDHDAVYRTFFSAYGKAGPWGDLMPRTAPTEPLTDQQRSAITSHTLDGPLPPWMPTYEIWRRQWTITFCAHQIAGDVDRAAGYLREELARADAYPDAYATIEALAGRGLQVALLSNADEDFLQSAVSRARLRFSVIQSSESLRAYKPHRAVFAALCHRLGRDPASVLYVGDSLPADVRGALNAGLRSAWISRSERVTPGIPPTPHVTLTQLSQLLDLFEGAHGS
ncbi:MAG: HAD family hydrolase [Dehalococcoidia bacterium]|nr:HAD family hydrolase [Dehalococcoidia bacterium]